MINFGLLGHLEGVGIPNVSSEMMARCFSNAVRFFPFLLPYFSSPKPTFVDVELTNKCNLRCGMCWFHGEGGIGDRYRGSELTSDEVIGFIRQIANTRPKIYLGGAEPFVGKDLLSILETIKNFKLYVFFTTNGTLLDQDKITKVVDLGVDHIIFSLDGDEELHDRIRGKGVFRTVTSNIKDLCTWRNKNNSNKPLISVNITITPLIIGHLQETIDSIKKATEDKVDIYRIHQLWYITSRELSLHQSATKEFLDCSAPGAACHLTPLSKDINPLTLSEEISRLARSEKIKCFPNLNYSDLLDYYTECSPSQYRCLAPFYRVVIKPNGDVKFCPDEWIDDYIIGNIRVDDLEHIWKSEKARHFRSVILRQKSFPACKRCSWMYSLRQ